MKKIIPIPFAMLFYTLIFSLVFYGQSSSLEVQWIQGGITWNNIEDNLMYNSNLSIQSKNVYVSSPYEPSIRFEDFMFRYTFGSNQNHIKKGNDLKLEAK